MFKIGDKVKIIEANLLYDQKIGDITEVIQVESNSYKKYAWVKGTKLFPHGLCYEVHKLQLVNKTPILDINPDKGGIKADSLKPDLSLIPTDAIWGTAAALSYGANKYARHNFRKGIAYSRLVAATMRHLTAWNEGEELDSESGLSHLDHAMASLAMLKFMSVNKTEMDDRFKVEKKSLNQRAKDTFPENDGKNR
jgi:Domain of unknown function (DUF5664)